MIAALRTRSLFSREELARIIAPLTLTEVLTLMFSTPATQSELIPGDHRLEIGLKGAWPKIFRRIRRVYRFFYRAVRFVLRRIWRYTKRGLRFGLRVLRRIVRLPLRPAQTFYGLMSGALDISQTSSPLWQRLMPLRKYQPTWLVRPIIWLLEPIERGLTWAHTMLTPEELRGENALSLSSLADELQAATDAEQTDEAMQEVLEAEAEVPQAFVPPTGIKKLLLSGRIRKHYRASEIAILDLAWLHANQGIYPEDVNTAQKLYGWFEERYGLSSFTHMHLVDYALLASRLGLRDKAIELSRRAKSPIDFLQQISPKKLATTAALGIQHSLDRSYRYNLELSVQPKFLRQDAKNPLRGQQNPIEYITHNRSLVLSWLGKLSDAIIPSDVAPLGILDEPRRSLLDSLAAPQQLKQISEGPKVTVVMSAFQPDESILSAARSVLNSTYQNLELMVIDDCSGDEYRQLLEQVAQLDSRVKVLFQSENGGTYRIRNRAMDEATGELMTFHDSDDWIHPQRLEKQVKKLIKSGKIANISMSTRLTQNLEAAESIRRLRIGLCEPSLLFWRERAKEKVGYFDTVRKGGDAEYRRRLERAFGEDLDVIDPFRCLTIQRADNGGLTQGDLGFRWIVDFRLVYRDSFNHFQKNSETRFVPRSEERSFYAPRPMRFPRSLETGTRKFDLVLAANAHDPLNAKELVAATTEAVAAGKKVGYYQLNSPYPYSNPKTIRGAVLDLMNAGQLESVYPSDQLEIGELKILAPASFLASFRPLEYRWQVAKRSRAASPSESWSVEGEGISRRTQQLMNKLGKKTRG